MSILISGVGLPKSCHNCPCAVELFDYCDNTHSCECNILQKDTTNYSTERRKDCPLIEIPAPHGRLIDANELEDLIVNEFDGVCTYDVSPNEAVSDFQSIIDRCKTIIEVER